MRSIWVAFALGIGIVGSASANIIQVPSAHSTIQAGINAAVSGDTVQVAPGTYTGPSNRNLDFAGKNILPCSSEGAAITIIDCQSLGRGMRFHSGETAAAIVQGFTIRNGLANGTFGGAISVESGANPTIRDCRFTLNHANTGGGVFVSSGVTLTDCDFEDNSADNYGGGVYAESATGRNGAGAYLLNGTASVDSCSFTSNTATWGAGGLQTKEVEAFTLTGSVFEDNVATTRGPAYYDSGGGGLLSNGSSGIVVQPTISDCIFTRNQALGDNAGGGMVGGQAVVERCVFTDNHADNSGGGASGGHRWLNCVFEGNTALVGGGLNGGQEIIGCRFTDNHAHNGGGCDPTGLGLDGGSTVSRCEFSGNSAVNRGGGLYWAPSVTFAIEDSRFSNNSAASQGGGMWAFFSRPSSVTRCTFEGNTASVGGAVSIGGPAAAPPVTLSSSTVVSNGASIGGGIFVAIPVEITNTIIAFGTQGEAVTCGGSGIGVMSCTDIFGNAGGDWTACIVDQVGINGNFSLNPLFCNFGERDYTLAQTSPCTAANAPAGCGLIGAHPVDCATPIGIADGGAPAVTPILRVTPNPVRGSGMVEWSGVADRAELRLYDGTGRLVARHDSGGAGRRASAGRLSWNALVGTHRVPAGVYFLRLSDGGRTRASARLVVVR